MAYIPRKVSLLDLIAERLRGKTMSEWVRLGIMLAGVAVITWSAVQQHEFRIDKLENSFEQHLDKHDAQNKEVLKAIQSLEIQVTRIQK